MELLGEHRRVTGLPCERDGDSERWPPSCSLSSSSALCLPGVSQVSSCTAPRTLWAGGSFLVRGPGNPGSHDSGVTAQPCSPAISGPPSFPGVGTQVGGGCTRPSAGLREEEVSPQPTGRSAGLVISGLLRAVPGVLEGDRHVSTVGRRQPCSAHRREGLGETLWAGVWALLLATWGKSLFLPEPQCAHPEMG